MSAALSTRDLHQVAERILRDSGQIDRDGYMTCPVIDIDHIVEVGLGYQVVGSDRRGQWRLPLRRLAAVDVNHRKIVIHRRVMENHDQESTYRLLLAHEASHAIVHREHAKQPGLPFDDRDLVEGPNRKLTFSSAMKTELEFEANVLASLLLIPQADMLVALAPHIAKYAAADWSRTVIGNRELEARAALDYHTSAISVLCTRFQVTESVAKITLDYWSALERPPHTWQTSTALLELSSPPILANLVHDYQNRSNFLHFGRNFNDHMRVIAFSRLREFYESSGRGDAEQPLRAWYKEAERAAWTCWADVKSMYASADSPGNDRVVFNIGGNKYRLIVKVDYSAKKVFIRWIGTHADYDKLPDVRQI